MEYLSAAQIERILDDVIELFLIPRFLELGMDATGEWRENLQSSGQYIRGRHYTEQLVNGRAPGTFAPIEPLKRWAMAKLGLDDREALGAAFAISRKLEAEGSNYWIQGGTTLLEVLTSDEVVNFITQNAQPFVQQQVDIEIREYLRDALT